MSERNGDRARFQKERRRRIHRRQRVQALMAASRGQRSVEHVSDAINKGIAPTFTSAESQAASASMLDEGGPMRAED